jgi:hypothetical protein
MTVTYDSKFLFAFSAFLQVSDRGAPLHADLDMRVLFMIIAIIAAITFLPLLFGLLFCFLLARCLGIRLQPCGQDNGVVVSSHL